MKRITNHNQEETRFNEVDKVSVKNLNTLTNTIALKNHSRLPPVDTVSQKSYKSLHPSQVSRHSRIILKNPEDKREKFATSTEEKQSDPV